LLLLLKFQLLPLLPLLKLQSLLQMPLLKEEVVSSVTFPRLPQLLLKIHQLVVGGRVQVAGSIATVQKSSIVWHPGVCEVR
jgi:hypothetical protein